MFRKIYRIARSSGAQKTESLLVTTQELTRNASVDSDTAYEP